MLFKIQQQYVMMITNFDQKVVINKNQYIELYSHMLIPAAHFKEFDYTVSILSPKRKDHCWLNAFQSAYCDLSVLSRLWFYCVCV